MRLHHLANKYVLKIEKLGQGGSRTEHYEHSCSNATTGACDSEGTDIG